MKSSNQVLYIEQMYSVLICLTFSIVCCSYVHVLYV